MSRADELEAMTVLAADAAAFPPARRAARRALTLLSRPPRMERCALCRQLAFEDELLVEYRVFRHRACPPSPLDGDDRGELVAAEWGIESEEGAA